MRHGRQVLVIAVLVLTLQGCTVGQPWNEAGDMEDAQSTAPEWTEQEDGLSAQGSPGPGLSCEDIRPAELGPSRSLIIPANGPEADCGPGVGNGAGYQALLNSGPFGAVAWTVVTANGRQTGMIFGGDFGSQLVPLRGGFHLLRFSFPDAVTLVAHSAEGQFLRQTLLSPAPAESVDIAPDSRGGTVIVWSVAVGSDTRHLLLQAFDEKGRPRSEPHLVRSVSTAGLSTLVGVDPRGRILVLWITEGSSTWMGQWLRWDGTARTEPFPALDALDPSTFLSGASLQPLSGEGLVLRLGAQWVRQFPSAEPTSLPAPAWLADNPGTELALIRRERAYVLVLPPTFVEGTGCQEQLRFFTRDGVACGDLTLPIGGSDCSERQLGVARDGTVTQQIELNIPANDQCAWRWWPRLLR